MAWMILGIAVPAAVIAVIWLRTRRPSRLERLRAHARLEEALYRSRQSGVRVLKDDDPAAPHGNAGSNGTGGG